MVDTIRRWGDRKAAVGDNPINIEEAILQRAPGLAGLNNVAPTSIVLTSGNDLGHFTFDGTTLDVSSSGVASLMPSGTYTLRFSIAYNLTEPFDIREVDLIYTFPGNVRYVDPELGSDTANGLTKETAWQHLPGDPDATDNAAVFEPTGSAVISIKGDNTYRSAGFTAVNNCVYTYLNWGTEKPEITTFTPLPSPTTATSGEVYNNPNIANIKKFPGVALKRLQPFRNGEDIVYPAQFPSAGVDPIIDSQEPTVDGTRGMRQIPITPGLETGNLILLNTGQDTNNDGIGDGPWTYRLTWAELVTQFPGVNFQGYTIWTWSGANHICPCTINAYNISTGEITFTCDLQPIVTYGFISVNISGHPVFIDGENQYAYSATDTYAWVDSGTYEYSIGQTVLDNTGVSGGLFNLKISGGWSSGVNDMGGGLVSSGPVGEYQVWDCDFEYFTSDHNVIAVISTSSDSIVSDWSIARNTFSKSYRTSGIQLSNVENWDHYIYDNYFNKIGFTGIFANNTFNLKDVCNISKDCQAIHGTGRAYHIIGTSTTGTINSGSNQLVLPAGMGSQFSVGRTIEVRGAGSSSSVLYAKIDSITDDTLTLDQNASTEAINTIVTEGLSLNLLVDRALTLNTTRPLTGHTLTNAVIKNSIFEIDGNTQQALQLWSNAVNILFERCIFTHKQGVDRLNRSDTVVFRGTGEVKNCIIDGSSGNSARLKYTDNLVTYLSENEPVPSIQSNTTPDTGNSYNPYSVWDGSIPPAWRRVLGLGYIGPVEVIHSLSSLTYSSLVDRDPGSILTSTWALLDTDSPSRTITVTGGEFRVSNTASVIGASGWYNTPTEVEGGKYIQLRRTLASTTNTREEVIVDQGDDMVDTWVTTTKRGSGFPVVRFTGDDQFRQASASVFSNNASPKLTIGLLHFMKTVASNPFTDNVTFLGQAGGAPISWQVETIGNNTIRFTIRNASNNILLQFQTGVIVEANVYNFLLSVDLSKSTIEEAVKYYINGLEGNMQNVTFNPSAVGGQDIPYNVSTNWRMGYGIVDTEVGAFFAHDDFIDLDVPANRDKFLPVQIGTNGQTPFGTVPKIFLTGPKSVWDSANGTIGPQRGTLSQATNIAATTVGTTVLGASTWPSYDFATSIEVSSPSIAYADSSVQCTITIPGPISESKSVTLTDNQSGVFTPSTINFMSSEDPQSVNVTYTPNTPGNTTITASASGLTDGTSNLIVADSIATTYTVIGPTTATANVDTLFTIQLNGSNPTGTTVDVFVFGVPSTVSANPILVEPGSRSADFNIVFNGSGNASIVTENTEGLTDPTPKTITTTLGLSILPKGVPVTLSPTQYAALIQSTTAASLDPILNNVTILHKSGLNNSGNDIVTRVHYSITAPVENILSVTEFTELDVEQLDNIPDGNDIVITIPEDSLVELKYID